MAHATAGAALRAADRARRPRASLLAWPPPAWAAVAVFLIIAALVGARVLLYAVVDGQPRLPRFGMMDFRDAIYYPTRAFLDGGNPYDVAAYRPRYPVGLPFPLYSPLALVVYAPLQLLSFENGARLMLLLNLSLLPVVAYLALRLAAVPAPAGAVFAVATAALLSRGGYVSLVLGQCTIYVVAALYAALLYAERRPWVAAIGLTLATIKPTFGVPVAILLLAQGRLGVVWRTALIGGLATLAPVAVLAERAGTLGALLATLGGNYHGAAEGVGAANAATAPLRLDVSSFIARITGTVPGMLVELLTGIAVLAAGAALLRGTRDDAPGRQLQLTVICLTTLLWTYHQGYDVLLLSAPLAAVVLTPWVTQAGGTPAMRVALAALLAVPTLNYLMSRSFLESIGDSLSGTSPGIIALASVNGAALLAAFALCAVLIWRQRAAAPARGAA